MPITYEQIMDELDNLRHVDGAATDAHAAGVQETRQRVIDAFRSSFFYMLLEPETYTVVLGLLQIVFASKE